MFQNMPLSMDGNSRVSADYGPALLAGHTGWTLAEQSSDAVFPGLVLRNVLEARRRESVLRTLGIGDNPDVSARTAEDRLGIS